MDEPKWMVSIIDSNEINHSIWLYAENNYKAFLLAKDYAEKKNYKKPYKIEFISCL